jgi:hypothetical membrane protein
MRVLNGIRRWGPLLGLCGAVAFMCLWLAAIMADGHWLFGVETLSELGGHRPGRCYFNTAVTIMGLLAIPYGLALYLRYRQSIVGKGSAGLLLLACLFLVGVGVFPIDTGAPHTFFSWAFFSTIIISLTVMLWPMGKDAVLSLSGRGLTTTVVLTAYVTIALVALGVMELALSEALVVIALDLWVIVTCIMLLRASFTPGSGS